MTKFFRLSLLILFISSCATHQSRLSSVRHNLTLGQCDSSIKALQEMAQKEGKDQLLFLMEFGAALQICGEYKKSNDVLLQAHKLSEELDYISVSKVTGATLLNEEMIQYKGDIFERIFINAMAALNFLELGQLDEAMVEVRRINEKYNKFSAEDKKYFELNSFAQYLSGLIYELNKKYDDACISYQKAYKLDKTFREVGIDALSSCWRAKRSDEFERLRADISPSEDDMKYIKRKSNNEKVIIFLQGLGPSKAPRIEDHLYAQLVPSLSSTKKMRAVYTNVKNTDVSINSQPVYSVTKAAIDTLESEYSSLAARRLGARIAKEVVADQVRQKDKTLGNIAWLVMVASERADLRNWSLLPESIQTLRINPKRGEKVQLLGLGQFDTVSEVISEIDLSVTEKKQVYIVRSIK